MLPSRALWIYVPKGFTNICMNLGQFAYLLACLGIVAEKKEKLEEAESLSQGKRQTALFLSM